MMRLQSLILPFWSSAAIRTLTTNPDQRTHRPAKPATRKRKSQPLKPKLLQQSKANLSLPRRKRQESEIAINRTVQKRYEKLLAGKIRGDQWRKSDKPPTEFGFIDAARVKFEAGIYNRDGIGYAHYLSLPETKSGAVFYATWSGALTDTITLPEGAPTGEYIIRARVGGFETAPARRR